MANGYVLNQVPTTYGGALSLLAEMLVAAGWTYKASGDGLAAYNATGKVFVGTGSGATNWNNAKAWARLADPGGVRELILQHDAAGGARFKYSALAKFVGGTPSATVTPSATDERVVRGGGTDAAPSYGSQWFAPALLTTGVKFQGRANGTAPYGFWFAGAAIPNGTPSTGIMMDPVTSVPEDLDPVVMHVGGANAFRSGFGTDNAATQPGGGTEGTWSQMAPDAAGANYKYVHAVAAAVLSVGTVSSTGLAVNPFNGKHEAYPVSYLRTTAYPTPYGFKGWSTLARWTTITRLNFLDTLDNRNWICVGYLWLPWDGVTVPSA